GQALLRGVSELLTRLDVLAGRRLCYVEEVSRLESGAWRVHWWDLRGENPRRLEPLALADSEALRQVFPNRLYLVPVAEAGGPNAPPSLRLLSPLLTYDAETGEVFFLNTRRQKQRTEYL